jgi:hypothetical protein
VEAAAAAAVCISFRREMPVCMDALYAPSARVCNRRVTITQSDDSA